MKVKKGRKRQDDRLEDRSLAVLERMVQMLRRDDDPTDAELTEINRELRKIEKQTDER